VGKEGSHSSENPVFNAQPSGFLRLLLGFTFYSVILKLVSDN